MRYVAGISIIFLSLVFISACSSVSIKEYADNKPVMVVEEFFNGSLSAHGIVKNRGQQVIRYFSATIEASWADGVGTLDENA